MKRPVLGKRVYFTAAQWDVAVNLLANAINNCSSAPVSVLDTALLAMHEAEVIYEPKILTRKRVGNCECGTIPCSCTFTHY